MFFYASSFDLFDQNWEIESFRTMTHFWHIFNMALNEYNKKRLFDHTPEPTGGKSVNRY
jgi:hypothetical protein